MSTLRHKIEVELAPPRRRQQVVRVEAHVRPQPIVEHVVARRCAGSSARRSAAGTSAVDARRRIAPLPRPRQRRRRQVGRPHRERAGRARRSSIASVHASSPLAQPALHAATGARSVGSTRSPARRAARDGGRSASRPRARARSAAPSSPASAVAARDTYSSLADAERRRPLAHARLERPRRRIEPGARRAAAAPARSCTRYR